MKLNFWKIIEIIQAVIEFLKKGRDDGLWTDPKSLEPAPGETSPDHSDNNDTPPLA